MFFVITFYDFDLPHLLICYPFTLFTALIWPLGNIFRWLSDTDLILVNQQSIIYATNSKYVDELNQMPTVYWICWFMETFLL